MPPPDAPPGKAFATTRWTLVLAARSGDSDECRRGLDDLCRTYWVPLYAYLRRRGCSSEQAEDVTQGFFAHILEKRTLDSADRERGRFRSFLLAAITRFLSNDRRRENAAKRGGGRRPLPLDVETGERWYSREPAHDLSPDRVYQRAWAHLVVERALAKLRDEYDRAGKAGLFDRLRPHLGGDAPPEPYADLAGALGLSEGAVKLAVHRLRRRCGERIRREIAETVSDPADIGGEISDLFGALGA